jgi:exopolysaccharide biosynthesis polyprenyl glycosylphosphotransferase
MTKRHLMTLRLTLLLADEVTAFLVFMAVSYVRFQELDPNAVWSIGIEIPIAAVLFASTWVVVLGVMGLYRLRARWSLMSEARDIARAAVLLVAVVLSSLFLLHQDDASRLFLAILFIAQPVVTLANRALFRSWFNALRRQSRNRSYMLVVGTGTLAQDFADAVERHPSLGLKVIGHVTVPEDQRRATDPKGPDLGLAEDSEGAKAVTRPILGSIYDIGSLFQTNVVDEVAVCLPASASSYLEPIIAIAADEGKTVRVPTDPAQELLSYTVQEEFENFVVRSVIHDSQRDLELVLKRMLDVIGGLVALLILSPVMLMTALAIRWRDGSPILFRQTRVGRHGRPFTIYKFRTMIPDAEIHHQDVVDRELGNRSPFRLREDPRVTDLGLFLRRSSIDEIPQLFNVLRGEMSLVGPRPPLPSEVRKYDIWHRRRLSMRPGMTGLWQISARLDHPFDEVAELDLRYIDQWSLWTDLRILVRTVPAVLLARGR